MTKDLNKGISSIEYNLLNLPSRITYSDGRMADYVYSATGAKLSVTYTNGIRFTTIDPMAEKYYGVSPYAYCVGNPMKFIDPDGRSVYMLFYTTGNNRGDEMFRAAAETRKYDIEHSDIFDPSNDIVILSPIQDLADIGQFVGNVRQNTPEMMNGNFSYPTYMVGGKSLGLTGRIFPTFSPANPMRSSINGKGKVDKYYQPGRRY